MIRNNVLTTILLLKILPVDNDAIMFAMNSDFSDFEDALQYFAALTNNCSHIISRNLRHYKRSDLPVLTAEDF